MRLSNGYRMIVWYATVLQAVTGVLILLYGSKLQTATLSPLNDYFDAWPTVGVLLLISAGLAVMVLTRDKSALLLLPQQVIVLIQGAIALQLAGAGHYGDGTVRPSLFILADQLPAIVLAAFYTVALIRSR